MNGTKAMKLKFDRAKYWANRCGGVFAILFVGVQISLGQSGSPAPPPAAQSQVMTTTTTEQEPAAPLPPEQLDSLVAPIALYSDPLLATTLAASTYPLEIIQLQQWMDRNKNLKDKALADAVAKQPWDPSVQSLAVTPDVVQRLAGNIQWTTDLGNAFLAQQSDVMSAVQRMRGKAEGTGNLKTSAQQKVETQTVEGGKQVIVIEPAQPDVVYVPSYDPQVVYGAAPPAYPYYPYTYPGYYPGMGLAWGAAGFALGAWAGGAWGDCDWHGGGDININNNNNFNRTANRNTNRNVNRGQAGQGNRWQHNPQHRGNAPYGNRQTADKFGGRGPGGAGGVGRPGGAGGVGGVGRPGGAGGVGKPGGAGGVGGIGKPGGAGGVGKPGGAGRPGGAGSAARPGGGGASRPSAATRPSGGGGANKVGSRSPSSGASARGGGFGGGGGGNAARASSSRGGKSMGGGGYSRGGGSYGGSRGGGARGGGGGGRGGGGRGGGGGGRR
jgi:Protein of unknown function (DUF3300)